MSKKEYVKCAKRSLQLQMRANLFTVSKFYESHASFNKYRGISIHKIHINVLCIFYTLSSFFVQNLTAHLWVLRNLKIGLLVVRVSIHLDQPKMFCKPDTHKTIEPNRDIWCFVLFFFFDNQNCLISNGFRTMAGLIRDQYTNSWYEDRAFPQLQFMYKNCYHVGQSIAEPE